MSEIKRYALIESATGRVANIVLWDGASEFTPLAGHELREALPEDVIEPSTTETNS